jgi:hypothetical protein
VEVKGGGRELRRRWKRARVGVELTLRAPMATGKSGQVKTGLLVFICDLGGGAVCGATGGSLLAPGNSWRGQLHCCGGTGHGSRAHVCRGNAADGAMATWAARGARVHIAEVTVLCARAWTSSSDGVRRAPVDQAQTPMQGQRRDAGRSDA